MKNVVFAVILVLLYGCGGEPFTSGFSAVQVETDGGLPPGTGGSVATSTGGAPGTGGASGATGGASQATGGSFHNTGGSSQETGGSSQTGGAPSSTGGSLATGGAPEVDAGGTPNSTGGVSETGGAPSTGGDTGSCSAGQKMCGGVCVNNGPSNGCSSTSCTACPIQAPPHGVQACNQGQCDFVCLAGYTKSGGSCISTLPVVCGGQTCMNSCAISTQCCKSAGGCGCDIPSLGCQ